MSEKHNDVDPKTGTVTYRGSCEITKGDHSSMPRRTVGPLSRADPSNFSLTTQPELFYNTHENILSGFFRTTSSFRHTVIKR